MTGTRQPTSAMPDPVRLRALIGTIEDVAVIPAAASIAMDMVLRAAVRQRAAVLVHRGLGEARARAVEALGREAIRIVTADDLEISPSEVERLLDGPPLDALLVELGVDGGKFTVPLEAIGRAVRRRRGLLLIAEASRALGRLPLEMDRWGVDCVVAGSEELPDPVPTHSLVAMSGRMVHRLNAARGRGTALDPAFYRLSAPRP